MAKLKPFVTDEQWIRLGPWWPKPQPSPKGEPKPRGNKEVFDGIIWVWPTGAGWNHLADRYPSASTCQPSLQLWEVPGVWLQIWPKFLSELEQQGQLDWPGPKKGPRRWKNQRREGSKVDGGGRWPRCPYRC